MITLVLLWQFMAIPLLLEPGEDGNSTDLGAIHFIRSGYDWNFDIKVTPHSITPSSASGSVFDISNSSGNFHLVARSDVRVEHWFKNTTNNWMFVGYIDGTNADSGDNYGVSI